MSLKAFHVVFILISVLFSIGMSFWAFKTGASEGLGWGSGVAALLMTAYGVRFLVKSKSIIT
jgi:hypothetical protein